MHNPILTLLLVHSDFCTPHSSACCEYCAGTLPHTRTAPRHKSRTVPSTLSHEAPSYLQIISSPRQCAHNGSPNHVCTSGRTNTSTTWLPCPSRALICCCTDTIATILTSATSSFQKQFKTCGQYCPRRSTQQNLWHVRPLNQLIFNVNSCPKQAPAELAQVMFDQFSC